MVGRIKGTLRCADGAVVPITSKRIMDAIRERDDLVAHRDARIATMREALDKAAVRDVELRALLSSRWVRLGKWLRVVR